MNCECVAANPEMHSLIRRATECNYNRRGLTQWYYTTNAEALGLVHEPRLPRVFHSVLKHVFGPAADSRRARRPRRSLACRTISRKCQLCPRSRNEIYSGENKKYGKKCETFTHRSGPILLGCESLPQYFEPNPWERCFSACGP